MRKLWVWSEVVPRLKICPQKELWHRLPFFKKGKIKEGASLEDVLSGGRLLIHKAHLGFEVSFGEFSLMKYIQFCVAM
jgi:hypothetical protein